MIGIKAEIRKKIRRNILFCVLGMLGISVQFTPDRGENERKKCLAKYGAFQLVVFDFIRDMVMRMKGRIDLRGCKLEHAKWFCPGVWMGGGMGERHDTCF